MCLIIQVTTDYISRLLKKQNKHTTQKPIKKWHPTPDPSRTACPQKHCVQVSFFMYQTTHCPDLPPKPITIFESVRVSRLDTAFITSQTEQMWKMWSVSKTDCRSTHHASRFRNLIRTSTKVMDTECAKSGGKFSSFHMSSWVVACHLCRVRVPPFLQGMYFCVSHRDCSGSGKYLNFLFLLTPTAVYISLHLLWPGVYFRTI